MSAETFLLLLGRSSRENGRLDLPLTVSLFRWHLVLMHSSGCDKETSCLAVADRQTLL